MTTPFKIGDRVRVNLKCAGLYVQPWRSRFKARRVGTVISEPRADKSVMVEFDHGRVKNPENWCIRVLLSDLELTENEK